jgi:hypothetical protein
LKNSDAGKTCSYGYITFKVRGYTYISAKLDYMSSQEDKKIQFYHSAQIWYIFYGLYINDLSVNISSPFVQTTICLDFIQNVYWKKKERMCFHIQNASWLQEPISISRLLLPIQIVNWTIYPLRKIRRFHFIIVHKYDTFLWVIHKQFVS